MIFKLTCDDLEEINKWYKKRKMEQISIGMLPKNGFIIHGMCAVFIYLTDSNIALIEGLVSNPDNSDIKNAKAIRELITLAVGFAATLKNKIFVFTESKGAMKLVEGLGFKSIGNKAMFLRG